MSSGIYCRRRNSCKLSNSIVMDEYEKCISNKKDFQSNQKSSSVKTSVSPHRITNSSNDKKWEEGQNVRAIFSQDEKYYEAVIKKVFDKEYGLVKFLGYDNEEPVKLKELQPSSGEEFIKEQIKLAEEYCKNDEESDDEESEEDRVEYDEIEWKSGMPCRALYKQNDVIYEATVKKVYVHNKKALVLMTGFNILYEADFHNMYESIFDLRQKQEKEAAKYMAERMETASNKNPMAPKDVLLNISNGENDVKIYENIQPVSNITVPPPPMPDMSQQCGKFPNDLNLSNTSTSNSCIYSQTQGLMQPETENEALACLVSSNYLSGYYADSIIYMDDGKSCIVPIGENLGSFSDELSVGDYITEFISTGPKAYCYHIAKGMECVKVKGFNLNENESAGGGFNF